MLKEIIVKHRYSLLTFLVIIFASVLYVYKLGSLPFAVHGDEGETALQALSALSTKNFFGVGWFDLPLLSFLPHAITMYLFGSNIIGDRLGSVVFGVLTLPFYYALISRLYTQKRAFIAAVFLATSHLWIALSRLGITYTQAAFLTILAYYFTYVGLKKKNIFFAVLGGISVSLCFYSYYAARMAPIPLLVFFLYSFLKKKTRRFTFFYFLIFLFSALLFYAPQAYYYLHHFSAFTSRANSVSIFSEAGHNWIGKDRSILELITIQTRQTFNIFAGDNSSQYGVKLLIFDFFTLIFFFVGLVNVSKKKIEEDLFIYVWLISAVFAQILTTSPSPIFIPRFVVGLPAFFVLCSRGAETVFSYLKVRRPFNLVFFGLVFILVIVLNLRIYFFEYPKQVEFMNIGDRNANAATKISYFFNKNKDYFVIFFSAPSLYGDFGTIRFLSPSLKTKTVTQSEFNETLSASFLEKNNRQKLAYVVYPQYKDSLPILLSKFSKNEIITVSNKTSVQFYLFLVK